MVARCSEITGKAEELARSKAFLVSHSAIREKAGSAHPSSSVFVCSCDMPSRLKMLNFQTKLIETDGHRHRIICQNENGPCPLLAICNALILRGALELPSHASDIDGSQLQHILIGWLVDKSAALDSGTAVDANRTFQVDEAIKIVQQGRLMAGLDVNPKFGSPESMEFTQGAHTALICIQTTQSPDDFQSALQTVWKLHRPLRCVCIALRACLLTGLCRIPIHTHAVATSYACKARLRHRHDGAHAELAIFDLCGLRLVHGWIVDEADAELLALLRNLSYNEAAVAVVESLQDEAAVRSVARSLSGPLPGSARRLVLMHHWCG